MLKFKENVRDVVGVPNQVKVQLIRVFLVVSINFNVLKSQTEISDLMPNFLKVRPNQAVHVFTFVELLGFIDPKSLNRTFSTEAKANANDWMDGSLPTPKVGI